MKRHALFAGVNDYADPHIQDLRCAVNDATELAGFFKHRARFDCAEALPNPRNCEAILDRVHDMTSGLGVGDEFLFFFAGHGIKTQDGHRLICAGDMLNAVKHSWAGLPLERIKAETSGVFNRLFLLDACRTDVLATSRGAAGAMEKGTRDLILGGATSADGEVGALTILCSCDDGECAGEILKYRHGLFSMAMLELLDEECSCGRRVLVTDDFVYNQIPARMRALAEKSDMVFNQKPQKEGPPILILDGDVVHAPSPSDGVVAPVLVKCPVCGRWRNKTETFDCRECGRESICIDHQDRKTFLCAVCEEEKACAADEKARPAALSKSGDVKTLVLPGGAEMKMIYCAPGEFMMGSPENEKGRHSDEALHHVKLTKGFWLGKYPVTQEQWKSVMGDNPSKFQGDDCPVEQISGDDCQTFLAKVTENVSRRFGGDARFPTEAEWEYACRAGAESAYATTVMNAIKDALPGMVFSWFTMLPPAQLPFRLDAMGWYEGNSGILSSRKGRTHSVGKKRANGWGFHDMHGNVWEWCADWYGDYCGDTDDPTGPAPGDRRVLRGGCWHSNAEDCRSARRYTDTPGSRYDSYGFRLCCSAE